MAVRWMIMGVILLQLCSCYGLQRSRLEDYPEYAYQPVAQAPVPGSVVATFLGTSTLYLQDGDTRILIDGFFTRPGNLLQLFFGQIETDRERVRQSLERLGISRLDALPVFHSHYDHAMDTAEIARLTGAQILGSESTTWIGRGAGLPESQLVTVEPRKAYRYGRFQIRFIPSKHVPLPGLIESTGMMGELDAPLHQPASIYDYREGETYAIVIEHPLGTAMLHSGAFLPDEMQGQKVDTLFLCTPGLPKLSLAEQDQFYREIIEETGVKQIVPVHWDDFTLPLDEPLLPLPRFAEDLDAALAFLKRKGPGPAISFWPAWTPITLFPASPVSAE
ncbi:MAG: MBL fold metallo-hydrolase [Candidatus Sericytochromatia bacterium]